MARRVRWHRPGRRRSTSVPDDVVRCRQVELARARQHPVAFIEFVFEIRLAPVQIEWIEMWLTRPESVLHGAVGLGKSALARGFCLWLLGVNPCEQIIWLSATQRQPKKSLHSMARLIENPRANSRLHAVFPALRPGTLWRSTEIEIERETDAADADPSVQVYGAFSDSILGARGTTLVVDDLCNFTNTLTADGREKMIDWFGGTVISRLTKGRLRIMVLGNYWHEHDATMDLVRAKGFFYKKTPAYREDPDTGERIPAVPEALDNAGIIALERKMGPLQAARALRCEGNTNELGRFMRLWFSKALEAGRGMEFRPRRVFGACYTGIDLGHRKKAGADRTSMVTTEVMANGRKRIVDIRSGRWRGPEIKRNIEEVSLRYGSTIGVENNAAQKLVMDLISDFTCIPLLDHNTNVNKHHYAHGVEGMANEVAQGFWIFPCPENARLDRDWGMIEEDGVIDTLPDGQPDPEIQALIAEALTYDPTAHTGDRLMAWWICKEIMRASAFGDFLNVEAIEDVPDLDFMSR